ncbi:MAG: winged helix-turn-helix transcriptional regulator [Acidobacteriota bacterium]|nr:winged helix-turn-helix transcriptional regulator [Acidobacteriota bacterium]
MAAYRSEPWMALGDPTRLAILELLVEAPAAVVDLARVLPVSRPAVSQHLKVLKEAGLVLDEPAGTRRIYRVRPEALAELRARLDRYWEQALTAYRTEVDQTSEEK